MKGTTLYPASDNSANSRKKKVFPAKFKWEEISPFSVTSQGIILGMHFNSLQLKVDYRLCLQLQSTANLHPKLV